MALTTVRPEGLGFVNGRRNLIINGAMQVAQRGTSFTGVGNGDSAYYLDRFKFAESGSPEGVYTISQDSNAPNGFGNSMKIDCTTAESALAANEMTRIIYSFEGQDLQRLKKGTADAETMTFSFYIKSNLTGTAIVGFYDQDNARYVAKSYTIDSANTWEKKILTYPADTTGAFDNDNASSMQFWMFLQAGSDVTSGTLPSTWESVTTANYAVGQTINVGSSTSNEILITGVQLEVGSNASDFEHHSFGEELSACQRYCQVRSSEGVNYGVFAGGGLVASNVAYFTIPHITTMRVAPSNSITGTFRVDSGNNTHTSFTFDRQTTHSLRAIVATSSITSSVGQLQADATNISTIISDAEL
jgi:hypothetical protein